MKVHIAVVVLANLLAATAEDAVGQGSETFALVNLGSVDGKNYFYDNTARNWFDARAFCIESGMNLATIETASQAAFLKSKYSSSFRSVYWTAARDAQISRQFTWDHTGTAPTNLTGIEWAAYGGTLDYQTCVYYDSEPTQRFLLRSCSLGSGQTLCQT